MLVLASQSPRRRRLLEQAGIPFEAQAAAVEEYEPERGDPHAVSLENARRKAAAVGGEAVLAADTVVAVGDCLLAKPRGRDEARAMLRRLSGTTHRVVTGVAVRRGERWATASVETRVTMRPLAEEEIETYVQSGEGLGKAGAYAIQENADRFVTHVEGPFDNVIGLPVETVRRLLRELGLDLE